MRITVLTVPDCPNGPVVGQRITEALRSSDRSDADVSFVAVTTGEQAAALGMTGSPTVAALRAALEAATAGRAG